MIDIVKLYCDYCIKPIEEARNEMRAKVYSKKFSDFLLRPTYKKYLEKYDQMLFENYTKLGEILTEEYYFIKNLKRSDVILI